MIIYYERYVVIQAGIKGADGINYLDFLTEEEYLPDFGSLPKTINISTKRSKQIHRQNGC